MPAASLKIPVFNEASIPPVRVPNPIDPESGTTVLEALVLNHAVVKLGE